MSGDAITVLIVDDHAVVREGLRTFLELQEGIEVTGEASDGAEAVELASKLEPDVILMDLVMPKLDGVGAMRAVRERSPRSRVIVLTSFLDDQRLLPAVEAGADGYLLKDVEPAELARAIRTVQAGEAMIAPTVAGRLLRSLSRAADASPGRRQSDPPRTGGAGADRGRTLEQADRLRARDLGEDRQDPCGSSAIEARRYRPHTGGAAGGPERPRPAEVLGPITSGKRDRRAPSVAGMRTAIITGASRGLGLALARELAQRDWRLVIDARGAEALERAAVELRGQTSVEAMAGDVADEWHRGALISAAAGRIDLLVNNASTLGPSPQPELADYPTCELERVYSVNLHAPLALMQLALPLIPDDGRIINVTSDAALEPYPGWGGYGSSKAALEQLTAIFAAEQRGLRIYAVDPGDMRTQMHQEAFPGEDISDRPPPEDSVPGLLELIYGDRPSGRYRAQRADRAGDRSMSALAFELPKALEATAPPEARGERRDAVRLLVVDRENGSIVDSRFDCLPELLECGDLVVINISATLPAAVAARRSDGSAVRVHFATRAPELDESWRVIELRSDDGSRPERGRAGETIRLDAGASLELVAPYASGSRLLLAQFDAPIAVEEFLRVHGEPIRYGYVDRSWPLEAYQNVYAIAPGSAEMPSAGRPFTERLITQLVARGVAVAPLTLHTGVSSPERHEPPFAESYRVPIATARLVNSTRASGGRVIAVGTTVVRALETVARPGGIVTPGSGWTGLVIGPERGVRSIDGLITGWHEPQASHLDMLAAIAGHELLQRSYEQALDQGYLWHEFGDSHLILSRAGA